MKEKSNKFCVCCGAQLPMLSQQELIRIGCGIPLVDGSTIYHCLGKHTPEQIAKAAAGAPAFHRASEGRCKANVFDQDADEKYDRMIGSRDDQEMKGYQRK